MYMYYFPSDNLKYNCKSKTCVGSLVNYKYPGGIKLQFLKTFLLISWASVGRGSFIELVLLLYCTAPAWSLKEKQSKQYYKKVISFLHSSVKVNVQQSYDWISIL